jgi:hypothetical protein
MGRGVAFMQMQVQGAADGQSAVAAVVQPWEEARGSNSCWSSGEEGGGRAGGREWGSELKPSPAASGDL